VGLADDVRPEQLPEQRELGVAGSVRPPGDPIDRAVVLAQQDRPILALDGLREVARLILEHGEDPDAVDQRCIVREALGHSAAGSVADLLAPRGKDLLDEVVAADRRDGLEETRGEAAVIGREQFLGFGRDVVEVARPADAVPFRDVADQAGILERVQLLQDTRSGGAEGRGQRVGRGRPGLAEVDEDRPAEARGRWGGNCAAVRRRKVRDGRAGRRGNGCGGSRLRGVLHGREASRISW